eukprot:CAMPEP_0202364026 /NCGR_PEP_ID=MMETSP1126-20121109/15584_1 /ASSEMBLY_ACC=CAM_ASM_000457 /TAXON_ID=3047 /ORGANISM="Dunaliella tertiolecta, Strain CCMP1320" /LENGTH=1053 /DNA_ID=CAMNT_0048958557 /DNA_START=303 /DNA_END=3464 /DNA_ORIENTATION=+
MSDMEIALAALQRLPLPGMGPHSFQAQYVRYQGSEVNTQGCWAAVHSPGAAVQGHVADFVGLEVLEAPAEWAVPARVDRYIKPPFKVRVSVGYHGALSLPIRVKACLLTELDTQDITAWDPHPAMNDSPSVVKLSYTSLKGEVVKSHVIKASPETSAAVPQLSAAKDCSSCSSIQEATTRPSQEARGVGSRYAAGANPAGTKTSAEAGSNGHAPAPHSPMMEPSSNRQHSLDASNESVDSLHGRAATSRDVSQRQGLQPQPLAAQQQVAVHEMAFPDLRFAKPSRMHPVYVAFCCTLPFCEDTLFTLFTVPTVVTCRAEQSAAALKRLGRPPDLLVQANILRGNGPSGSGSAEKDRCSRETSSGSGSGSKEDESQGSGRAGAAIAKTGEPLVVPQPPGSYPAVFAEGQPYPAPSPTPFVSPAICVPAEGPPQARMAAAISAEAAAAQWQGGYGVQAPEGLGLQQQQQQLHGPVWPHGSGCSSSTLAAAAGGVMQPQQQPQLQAQAPMWAGGGGLGSNNDAGSVHNGSASMQDMQQHLPPLPSLAPCTSVVASPQMPCMMGGCPVLNGHELSPAGLAAWLEEEYDATGLARRLTPADVQTLVARSGLLQVPADPMHHQQLLAHFTSHMRGVFGILKQISSLWNQTHPIVVVAGFEVGREDAARLLARQPLGTFVCRISLSGTGGLALAVRASADHPQAGPDGIVHVLMTAQDLHMRRADTVVRDLPGATHLLDLYSCKRVDKRKIFATNYTHLKKLEHVAEPAVGVTFSNGSSNSRRPLAGSVAQQCPPYSNPLGMPTQQQAAQARHAAQTQLESTMTLECPLLVMPGLDGLGATMAMEAMPASCDAPLAATPLPLAPSPVPLPPTINGKEPTQPLPSANNGAAKGESTTLHPQPPSVMPPASVPTMYPSLTLDILDQGACAAMLNDSNRGTLGLGDNRLSMEAPMLRGASAFLDRGVSALLDSLPGPEGVGSTPLQAEGPSPPPLQPQQQRVLPQQVPTVAAQHQHQLSPLSTMAPMQQQVLPQPPQLPMEQDMPTVLLNKEEQSMVDMLMDG